MKEAYEYCKIQDKHICLSIPTLNSLLSLHASPFITEHTSSAKHNRSNIESSQALKEQIW